MSNLTKSNEHLLAQQIAAWRNDEVSNEERAMLENHLVDCPECREQVVLLQQALQADPAFEQSPEFAQLLQIGEDAAQRAWQARQAKARIAQVGAKSAGKATLWHWFTNGHTVGRLAGAAVAAVLLLALGLTGWWWLTLQAPLNRGREAMQLAYREQRPGPTRISRFAYAPWRETRGHSSLVTDQTAFDRAERILQDLNAAHPRPASRHALGQLYLAARKFEPAIEQFAAASKTGPPNAQLHSDWGAALFEKSLSAFEDHRATELAQALEHFKQALELDSNLPEALFNRALCLQEMKSPQAGAAWQDYLKRDPTSPWAEEAQRNLRLLSEQK